MPSAFDATNSRENTSFSALIVSYLHFILFSCDFCECLLFHCNLMNSTHVGNILPKTMSFPFASHILFFFDVFLVCCRCLHHFSESCFYFSSSFNVSHSDIFYVSPFLSIQFVPSSCLIKIFQLYAHFQNIINVNKLQCCGLFRLREIKGNSTEPDNNLLPIEAVASLLLNEKVAIPFNFFFIFFAVNQPI